jgi:23S rRNA pseudouridine1911/1915/1917 synthase
MPECPNFDDERFSFVVSESENGMRLDVYLASRPQLRNYSRSYLKNLTKLGKIEINGNLAKPSNKLHEGDAVSVIIPQVEESSLQPEPVSFTPLYEDQDILVLVKPAGLVVHPAAGHQSGTLVHGLLHHCSTLSGINGEQRPGIVHRLDQDTSGVMVVAKNDRSHRILVRQFSERQVKKIYLALVHGVPDATQGHINFAIGRHPLNRKKMAARFDGGREAVTDWRVIETFGKRYSLLEVRPLTGRTHQIRVHLSHIGHPVIGDPVYGKRRKNHHLAMGNVRLCLHASILSFSHPSTGRFLQFTADMPIEMRELIQQLRSLLDGSETL